MAYLIPELLHSSRGSSERKFALVLSLGHPHLSLTKDVFQCVAEEEKLNFP